MSADMLSLNSYTIIQYTQGGLGHYNLGKGEKKIRKIASKL